MHLCVKLFFPTSSLNALDRLKLEGKLKKNKMIFGNIGKIS